MKKFASNFANVALLFKKYRWGYLKAINKWSGEEPGRHLVENNQGLKNMALIREDKS